MNKSRLLGAFCAGVFGFLSLSSPAFAVTADNVKCDGCVGKGDIKKSAITRSKIKNGAISKGKLSDDVVLDLFQASKRYVIVDSSDQIVGGVVGGDVGQPLIITTQGYIAAMEAPNGKVSAPFRFYIRMPIVLVQLIWTFIIV